MATESSAPQKPEGKRLVLCLDGTWNTRDDNTNIFHLYNLVAETGTDGKRQLKEYQKGVGTGVLDHISGGVFGFGLDENIRRAYEWLIQHYEDGDEIFVFGFSRGAFTARSLTGLLSNCGLLKPGVPLTTSQLFQGYASMRPAQGLMGKINQWLNIGQRAFRPFYQLLHQKLEAQQQESQGVTGAVEKFRAGLSHVEKWLLQGSRSVHVQCIGVFDTVGSMGLDALGIHWLHTHKWAFHNTNPSRVIRHGYQALAIDENRANFAHISWNQFTPIQPAPIDAPPPPAAAGGPEIHQRWFVGAHANVGGGYPTNPLSLFPLIWIMECAGNHGLGFHRQISPPTMEQCLPLADGSERSLRDSYAEFLRPDLFSWLPFGLWTVLTLGRRNWREIAPPARTVMTRDGVQGRVESYDEQPHESALAFRNAVPAYRPQNLEEYLRRTAGPATIATPGAPGPAR